jgi:two-component system, chemotaxis family, chemotaxis protein CheY
MPDKIPIIALVDDDKIFQLTASKTLKATALTDKILQFENGDDALRFLREHKSDVETLPDYIFLDINMPMIDGWMFLEDFEVLKGNLKKSISIYMVSSSIDSRDIERAKKNINVKDYILKPVTREKFVELLRNVA